VSCTFVYKICKSVEIKDQDGKQSFIYRNTTFPTMVVLAGFGLNQWDQHLVFDQKVCLQRNIYKFGLSQFFRLGICNFDYFVGYNTYIDHQVGNNHTNRSN